MRQADDNVHECICLLAQLPGGDKYATKSSSHDYEWDIDVTVYKWGYDEVWYQSIKTWFLAWTMTGTSIN